MMHLSGTFGAPRNPFAPKNEQNEQCRQEVGASLNRLFSSIAAVKQSFDQVVLQADHSPGTILQLHFQQNQLEFEAKLVRKAIEQTAQKVNELARMAARDYTSAIEGLYTYTGGSITSLLQQRETTLQTPDTKSREHLVIASANEAFNTLSLLQKLRMESIVAPIHTDMHASFSSLKQQVQRVCAAFNQIVIVGDHRPSTIVEFQGLQNQLEIEAKLVRITIQQSPSNPELVVMAKRDYTSVIESLYCYVVQSTHAILTHPESSKENFKQYFKISADVSKLLMARLHAVRMELI